MLRVKATTQRLLAERLSSQLLPLLSPKHPLPSQRKRTRSGKRTRKAFRLLWQKLPYPYPLKVRSRLSPTQSPRPPPSHPIHTFLALPQPLVIILLPIQSHQKRQTARHRSLLPSLLYLPETCHPNRSQLGHPPSHSHPQELHLPKSPLVTNSLRRIPLPNTLPLLLLEQTKPWAQVNNLERLGLSPKLKPSTPVSPLPCPSSSQILSSFGNIGWKPLLTSAPEVEDLTDSKGEHQTLPKARPGLQGMPFPKSSPQEQEIEPTPCRQDTPTS